MLSFTPTMSISPVCSRISIHIKFDISYMQTHRSGSMFFTTDSPNHIQCSLLLIFLIILTENEGNEWQVQMFPMLGFKSCTHAIIRTTQTIAQAYMNT